MAAKTKAITIGAIMFILCSVYLLAGCNEAPKEYILSQQEQQLLQLAYDNRSVWESRNGKSASNIRVKQKNGYYFLLVTYPYSNSKIEAIGFEAKYTLNLGSETVREATLKEYDGGADTGVVYGLISYDVSDLAQDKKRALAKAITKKSGEITFRYGKTVY